METATFQPYEQYPNVKFCDHHATRLIVATVNAISKTTDDEGESD
jgi:hypothetical protein